MIWFLGFGIILAVYIPVLVLSARYEDGLVLKMSSRLYWVVMGTWDIVYSLFFESNDSLKIFYPILGALFMWLGVILLIHDYCIKKTD